MKKRIRNIIDWYFNTPIFFDAIFVLIVILINRYVSFIPFEILGKAQQLDLMSNLIETTVSLAGFILAALTIIVTFKSSLKAKGFEDADNAMEFLFSTGHYKEIVGVFKKSITELVLVFIILYCVWLSSANFKEVFLSNVLLASIIGTIAAIGRSLYILFDILSLQFLQKE